MPKKPADTGTEPFNAASEAVEVASGASSPEETTLPRPDPLQQSPNEGVPARPAEGAAAAPPPAPPRNVGGRPKGSKDTYKRPSRARPRGPAREWRPEPEPAPVVVEAEPLTLEKAKLQASAANEMYGAGLVLTLGDDAALKPEERAILDDALGSWMFDQKVTMPAWLSLCTLYTSVTIAKIRTPSGTVRASRWWDRVKTRIFRWRVRNEPNNDRGGSGDAGGGDRLAVVGNANGEARRAASAA